MRFNKYLLIIVFLFISVLPVFALSIKSASFSSSQNLYATGGTNWMTSESFSSISSVGDSAIGTSAATNNILSGFQAGLLLTSASSTAAVSSSVAINSVKFDGNTVFDNDYINAAAVITATITAQASTVSQEASRVIVDGTATTFSNLTSPNTFTSTNGALSYTLSLSSGTHTITIEAYDMNNNSTTYSRTLLVEGGLNATAVYIYPNPYNPNNGMGKIAYNLSSDADVSIYIFNAIGRLVYKRSYNSGSSGGSVGYNEVDFNGVSDFGATLSNDIYFIRIVSGGKVVGRSKIAILK